MASQSYRMPMYARLAVRDVDATRLWFQNVLGFETIFDIPRTMAHVRGRRYQDVLIVKSDLPEFAEVGQGITLSFTWTGSVDELAERIRAGNGRILDGPVDRPWNARELVIEEPNGYRFSFSHPVGGGEAEEISSGAKAGK